MLIPAHIRGPRGYGEPGADAPAPSVLGSSVGFSGDDGVAVPDSGSLEFTGDMSYELWLRPADFSVRRNPLAKAYSGEGMITQETDGRLTFYQGSWWGYSRGYEWFRTSGSLSAGVWSHVVVTRSGSTVTWYVNGVLDSEITATVSASVSSLPLMIGDGYTDGYVGGIDEVAVYGQALSAARGSGSLRRRWWGCCGVWVGGVG